MGCGRARALAEENQRRKDLTQRCGIGAGPRGTSVHRQTQMIYLDTSCLLKRLREEPESADVRSAVHGEDDVLVSSLTELETEVQLKAAAAGGEIRTGQWRQYQARLVALRNLEPFHFRHLPAAVFQTALRQHRHPQATFCRTLDRLHL